MTRIYEDALKAYEHNYVAHEARWDLCKQIGMSYRKATALRFGLAGNSETALYDHLQTLHYDKQAIIDSGLCCLQEDGTVKDAIQNSLVFPRYNLQTELSGFLIYDLSKSIWTQISIPGSDAFLGDHIDKRAEFLILCETPDQTLKLMACGLSNVIHGSIAENIDSLKSVSGPIILFPKVRENSAWVQQALTVLQESGIAVFCANDYLTDQQFEAIENVDSDELGDYLAIGNVFLWCNSETTQIEIPQGIEHIASNAFMECYDIEKIVIPDGVERLNTKLFGADVLKELHIPASVKEINPFILSRDAKCTIHTTKGTAAEAFAKTTHQKVVIKVRTK